MQNQIPLVGRDKASEYLNKFFHVYMINNDAKIRKRLEIIIVINGIILND